MIHVVARLVILSALLTVMPAMAAPSPAEQRARAYFGDDVLVDQDGRDHQFFSELLAGRVVLVNFVFTHCKDACPLMTQKLRAVRQQLGSRFGQPVHFLSLSVDPEHDKPDVLKTFARQQKTDEQAWRFLTAEPAVMHAVLARLGQLQANPQDHGTLLLIGRPTQGHWRKLRPDLPVEAIAAQLEDLVSSQQ